MTEDRDHIIHKKDRLQRRVPGERETILQTRDTDSTDKSAGEMDHLTRETARFQSGKILERGK